MKYMNKSINNKINIDTKEIGDRLFNKIKNIKKSEYNKKNEKSKLL